MLLKTIKCSINEEYGIIKVCRVKPTRDRLGQVSVYGFTKQPLNDIWAQVDIFYKYQVFQPFLLNFDIDMCETIKNQEKFIFSPKDFIINQIVFIGLKSMVPQLLNGCPFDGELGAKNVTLGSVASQILPQIIPAGTYKLRLRFHKKDNTTLLEVEGVALIDAKDTMKRMKIG